LACFYFFGLTQKSNKKSHPDSYRERSNFLKKSHRRKENELGVTGGASSISTIYLPLRFEGGLPSYSVFFAFGNA
jgi:hypothetical protein